MIFHWHDLLLTRIFFQRHSWPGRTGCWTACCECTLQNLHKRGLLRFGREMFHKDKHKYAMQRKAQVLTTKKKHMVDLNDEKRAYIGKPKICIPYLLAARAPKVASWIEVATKTPNIKECWMVGAGRKPSAGAGKSSLGISDAPRSYGGGVDRKYASSSQEIDTLGSRKLAPKHKKSIDARFTFGQQ